MNANTIRISISSCSSQIRCWQSSRNCAAKMNNEYLIDSNLFSLPRGFLL